MKKRHEQKLILLAIGVFVMLNIPFVLSYSSSSIVLGIPIFYLVIFIICALSITISLYVINRFHE